MWREHEIKHWWIQLWAAGVPLVPEPPSQSGFIWSLSLRRPQTSTPVVQDGVMYLGSDDLVIAVDIETQETIWEFETGGSVRSSPALVGSVIIVGSGDGKLYAIDTETGEMIWDYQTGGKISSSPAVVDGIVYFGSFDGKLYAIE
ncbi:MAG: PQQ-like beta-propeller repeat protein, partial [Dehalococcoidales bacterium]